MAFDQPLLRAVLQLGDKTIHIGGADDPYQFLAGGISGMETVEAAPAFREHAMLDGSYLVSARVPGRDISLLFEIADHAAREQLRSALIAFFSPKAEGMLTVTRGGVTRAIACRIAGRVLFTQETLYRYVRVKVPLFCPDPYFYDPAGCTVSLTQDAAGLLSFPLTLTAAAGMTAGTISRGRCLAIRNTGDTETGFLLTLSVAAGGGYAEETCVAEGPTIALQGAEEAEIHVLTTLRAGDTLTVCTEAGKKSIYKNGEACMLFDRESHFFSLPRGDHVLTLGADVLHGALQATAYFRTRYFGV